MRVALLQASLDGGGAGDLNEAGGLKEVRKPVPASRRRTIIWLFNRVLVMK